MTCVPTDAAAAPEPAPAPEPEPEVPQAAPSAWRTIHTRGSRRSRRTQATAPPPPPPPEPVPTTQSWATWQRESSHFCCGKRADAPDSEPCIPALSPHSACGASPRAASGQPGTVRASFSSRLSAPVRGRGGSRICISRYDLGHSLTTSCCYLPPHLSILCLIIYHVVYPPTSFVYHMRSVMLLLLTILMTSWISDVPSVDVCGCGSFFRAARDVSI